MRTFLLTFVASVVVAFAVAAPGAANAAAAAAVGPPSGSITSPANGAVIPLNTVVTFSGQGQDSDGTPLVSGQLFWSSSRDGFLGTGPSFQRNSSTLSPGSHTINLLLTGNNFQQNMVQITIWIGPPPTATPTNTPTATRTPTATLTNTPIPATNTPVPPTNTPTRTNTPRPADNTNTPVPPTKTNTPRPPTRTSTPTPTPRPQHGHPCADFNGDGRVGWADIEIILRAVQAHTHDLRFDLNGNGRIGLGDIWETFRQFGRRCDGVPPRATPTLVPPTATRTSTSTPTASPAADGPTATPTDALLPD